MKPMFKLFFSTWVMTSVCTKALGFCEVIKNPPSSEQWVKEQEKQILQSNQSQTYGKLAPFVRFATLQTLLRKNTNPKYATVSEGSLLRYVLEAKKTDTSSPKALSPASPCPQTSQATQRNQ